MEKNVLEEPNTHIHRGLFEEEDGNDGLDHCGSQFVLLERHPFRLAWSIVVCVLLGYTATAFLYRFIFCTFHIGPTGIEPIGEGDVGWKVVDTTVDALFWVDLVINFFLSYKDSRGREIDSMKMIAVHYLRFYFWINLVACLPEEAFSGIITASHSSGASGNTGDAGSNIDLAVTRVYRLQRISRLARLARVTRLVKVAHLMNTSEVWKWFQALRGVRVVNFIVGLMWALHLMACGWYLCAALHDDVAQTWVARRIVDSQNRTLLEQDPFEQWLVSMYFVLTVFTTVGFGDISAGTEAEIMYVACTMLVGAVVHSIIISEVIGIVTSTDEVQKVIDKQLALIDAYAAHTQLSPDTTKEMKSEIAWRAKKWTISGCFDKREMKELITGKYMPRWLIAKVPTSIFNGALLRNDFLRCVSSVPPRLPCLLAVHLLACDFEAGEIIYQMGDYAFHIYLVTAGTFAHVGRPSRKGGLDAMESDESRLEVAPAASVGAAAAAASEIALSGTNHCSESGELYPYMLFSHSSYFGDTEMLQGKPRLSTVRCERRGGGLTLHKTDFQEIQELFPQFAAQWAFRMRRREKHRKEALSLLTKPTNFRVLGTTLIQRAWRLKLLNAIPEQRRAEARLSELSCANQLWHRRPSAVAQAAGMDGRSSAGIGALRLEVEGLRMEIRQLIREQRKSRLEPAARGTTSVQFYVEPESISV